MIRNGFAVYNFAALFVDPLAPSAVVRSRFRASDCLSYHPFVTYHRKLFAGEAVK
jgi:hypothetical protein